MILVDSEIKAEMYRGNIIVTPYRAANLGSNSYDLTLGNILLTYKAKTLDCKTNHDTWEHVIDPIEGFTLMPGILYLGVTNEYTACCTNLVPNIEGKSSLARLGLKVHMTAGFGDVAFENHWTLELEVVQPLVVYANMPVAQIYWTMTMGTCSRPYNLKSDAKYREVSNLPQKSRMYKNFEEVSITS
jgi:dCTP deaminase